MTAYMIQSLVLWGRQTEALESVKWLGRQRNSQGGFVSTQDTVVALQALSMYSQRVPKIPLDMSVSVNLLKNSPNSQLAGFSKQLGKFRMDETTKLLLQKQKIEELPSNLAVETSGSGCVLLQTVLRFDVKSFTNDIVFTFFLRHNFHFFSQVQLSLFFLRYNTPEVPENSDFTLQAAQSSYSLNVCGKV